MFIMFDGCTASDNTLNVTCSVVSLIIEEGIYIYTTDPEDLTLAHKSNTF